MKMRLSMAAAALLLLSAPALASNCPNLMKKIDAALASEQQIAEELLGQIKNLRSEGENLHNEGRHDRSVRRLKMALKLFDQAVAKTAKE